VKETDYERIRREKNIRERGMRAIRERRERCQSSDEKREIYIIQMRYVEQNCQERELSRGRDVE
jgi:hypothetical protein